MRRATILVVFSCWFGLRDARADAHAEMARALEAQADVHPTPATLPRTSVAPQHAAAPSAVKRGLPAHGAGADHANAGAANANANANAAQGQAQAQAAQAAHQAQGQAASAAGQAQAQAAKARAASHPHPNK